MLNHYKTAFISERIKKKNTGIYLFGLIIGTFSPLILFISRISGSKRHIPDLPHNVYVNFIENALELFAYYMLPFLIILVASRITQLDHKSKGWKFMESLPVKKYGIYFSKFSILIITNVIAIVSFVTLSVIFVYLLCIIDIIPEIGLKDIPFMFCLNLILRLFVASLFLSSLQFALSTLISNFLWPIFIGIIGFSINTFFNESDIFLSWYPYAPISIIHKFPSGSEVGNVLTYIDYMSLMATIIILYIGFQWFKNKRFAALFKSKDKMIFKTLSVILIFGSLFMYLQKTKSLSSHSRTVLEGEIIGDVPIKNVEFIKRPRRDTLFIPVINNKFKIHLKDSLYLKTYKLTFDKKYPTKIFFGTNDSIHLKVAIKKDKHSSKIYGTRLAENQMINNNIGREVYEYMLLLMIKDSVYHKQTERFLNLLSDNLDEAKAALNSYKTIDNYVPNRDFINEEETFLNKKHRKYLNALRGAALAYNPNFKIEVPESLKVLKEPKIEIKEAIEDLNEFQEVLDNRASYSQLSNYDYKKAIGHLKNELANSSSNTITISKLINKMAKIMAEIGDRHSSIRSYDFDGREYKTYSLRLPFGVVPYQQKFIALKKQAHTYNYNYLYDDYRYIKSINGIPIDTLINNYNYKYKKAPLASKIAQGTSAIQRFGRLMFGNNLACSDSVQVVFTNGKKDKKESFKLVKENVGFVPKTAFDNLYNTQFMKSKKFGELHKIIDENIGYINIPAMLHYNNDIPELEEFFHATLKNFSNTKALIIDVRNNPGGGREILQTFANYIVQPEQSPWVANVAYLRTNKALNTDESSMSGRYLYAYNSEKFTADDKKAIDKFNKDFKIEKEFDKSKFSKPFYMVLRNGKISYKKPIYILADEKSFSAATVFVSAFKGLPNVKIVGVTTDGSSGNSKSTYLKNSDIRVKVSTMLSFQRNGKTLDGNGTEPDIYIPKDLEQIFTGKDTQLKKLVEIINKG